MTFDQQNQENSIVLPSSSQENEWKLGRLVGFFLEVGSPVG